MIKTKKKKPSATQLGLSKNLCRLSRSVSSHFTTSSPRAVYVHAPATPPKRLFSPSSPTLHCVLVVKSSLRSENVTYCLHVAHSCVKLQSKQTYGMITMYTYTTEELFVSTSSCGHGSPTYFVRPTAGAGDGRTIYEISQLYHLFGACSGLITHLRFIKYQY